MASSTESSTDSTVTLSITLLGTGSPLPDRHRAGPSGTRAVVDTLDYHSSPEEAGATAARAGVGTLVLTHCVPTFPPGDPVANEWRDRAATHFPGRVEIGDDLHRVDLLPPGRDEP